MGLSSLPADDAHIVVNKMNWSYMCTYVAVLRYSRFIISFPLIAAG